MVAGGYGSQGHPADPDEYGSRSQRNMMYLGIGCGFTLILAVGALVAAVIWASSTPEGGVRLRNDMEAYALDYIESKAILGPDEELLAYYDFTLSMDSTDAALLTDRRIIHHRKGTNDSIDLADVEDIRHRTEFLIGDVFVICSDSGKTLKLEIDPLGGGETFKTVLMKAWKIAREGDGKGRAPMGRRGGLPGGEEARLVIGSDVKSAVEAWIEYLPEDDAIEALKELGAPAELILLEKWRESRDRRLAMALGRMQARGALPGLVEYLMDESRDNLSRGDAALALSMIGDKAAVPPLINLLDHDDPEMKLHAIRALGRFRSQEAVPRLIERLEDPVPSVRTQAAWSLAAVKDRRAIGPMLALLPRSQDQDKCNLLHALGTLGDGKALDAVLRCTAQNEGYSVRLAAVMALKALEKEEALPRLAEILESEEGDLQYHAAHALGEIGSDLAVPALVNALEKAKPTVAGAIVNALTRLTGQDLGADHQAWKKWLDSR